MYSSVIVISRRFAAATEVSLKVGLWFAEGVEVGEVAEGDEAVLSCSFACGSPELVSVGCKAGCALLDVGELLGVEALS